ncbi:MAG: NTP transferase domain-containing protein [Candidatus Aenigmarchaeota archaeon]|nr:NTP transferase domain-containing protein [Candidatus Aenigmarchaeota archaeon]
MKAVILAAGKGTRLEPVTSTRSKPMIPLANKPLLEWTVENLIHIVDEIVLVVRKDQQDIIEHFSGTLKIKFVYQDEPRGTGHALLCCEKEIDSRFILLNGDEMIPRSDIETLSKKTELQLSVFYVENPKKYGVLKIEGNKIKKIDEKSETPQSNIVSAGLYLLDKRIFNYLKKIKPSARNELELTDGLNLMFADGIVVEPFSLSQWVTITHPWDYLDAQKLILDQTGTQIGRNVKIRPGAFIEEPVAIGDGAVLGPNCFIRKYSVIGKNCRIGNAVEIKNSIIMDNSYVSHLSYVGDSIVGKDCNIGAGCIIANLLLDDKKTIKVKIRDDVIDSGKRKLGAIIGDNVKFGVNVTIMPGRMIWPNMMIPPCTLIANDIKQQPVIDLEKRVL